MGTQVLTTLSITNTIFEHSLEQETTITIILLSYSTELSIDVIVDSTHTMVSISIQTVVELRTYSIQYIVTVVSSANNTTVSEGLKDSTSLATVEHALIIGLVRVEVNTLSIVLALAVTTRVDHTTLTVVLVTNDVINTIGTIDNLNDSFITEVRMINPLVVVIVAEEGLQLSLRTLLVILEQLDGFIVSISLQLEEAVDQ